jgi:hypothetical protein
MTKKLSKPKEKKYCKAELEVLSEVIDYTNKMIFECGNNNYQPLRRHAYGKTVVIDTELEGRLEFRLTSTSAPGPSKASGLATPHSSIGRLCSFIRPGFESESKLWGEYRVTEIRLFDRYAGQQFEENIRNFLRMEVLGDNGETTITNLRQNLHGQIVEKNRLEIQEELPLTELDPAKQNVEFDQSIELTETEQLSPEVEIVHMTIVEDDEHYYKDGLIEIDDSDELDDTHQDQAEEYFGLNEIFYVNRTFEQEKIVSRSPFGPMFVEGVAGSGKTSAALGRAKMLCDFNAESAIDEKSFREIVGEHLDYWAEKYAGQFSQDSSVGFVRTGELIQYLKETCRRIDLPHLPILEYKELQSKLRQHRKLERSGISGWRWTGLPEPRSSHIETTMNWFFAADKAIANNIGNGLIASLPSAEIISGHFKPEHRSSAFRVAKAAVDYLREKLNSTESSLRQPPVPGKFALDRLAERIFGAIQETRNHVLGANVYWFDDGNQALFAATESAMATQLINHKVPLFHRSSARLVFTNEDGLIDGSLCLTTLDGQLLDWNENARSLLAEGKALVKDEHGANFAAAYFNHEKLYFGLLPEATERIYVSREGRLRALSLRRGLGRQKLHLLPSEASLAEEGIEEEQSDEGEGQIDEQNNSIDVKTRSIDNQIVQSLNKNLLNPLAYVADAYLESLSNCSHFYPDPIVADNILKQLQNRKLAEADIDLLLCLSHLIGRGFQGKSPLFKEPPFYQSVFIDEVQDFTEQQIYLMAGQARPEYQAVTVVGDIGQKLHHGSHIDIPACFPGRAVPHVSLRENIRQFEAPGLALFSACFRAKLHEATKELAISEDLKSRLEKENGSIRGPESINCKTVEEMDQNIVEILREAPRGQTAAVILPSADMAEEIHNRLRPCLTEYLIDTELSERLDLSRRHLRHFTSVLNAKGLEFDMVVLPYIENYDLYEASQINRLYVGITRARKRLIFLNLESSPSTRLDEVWQCYNAEICQTNSVL